MLSELLRHSPTYSDALRITQTLSDLFRLYEFLRHSPNYSLSEFLRHSPTYSDTLRITQTLSDLLRRSQNYSDTLRFIQTLSEFLRHFLPYTDTLTRSHTPRINSKLSNFVITKFKNKNHIIILSSKERPKFPCLKGSAIRKRWRKNTAGQ